MKHISYFMKKKIHIFWPYGVNFSIKTGGRRQRHLSSQMKAIKMGRFKGCGM
jgi:hypothetical protein